MDILNPRDLQAQARRALARGREPKKLIYAFAGINLAMSLVVLVIDLWMEHEISGTGGLGNMGTRAVLATVQQASPLIVSFVAICLDLGYLHGLMRICRGQYADHTDLQMGFRKFWPLMRMGLLQGMICFAVIVLAFQLSYAIFMFTPWSDPLLELIYPMAAAGVTTPDEAALTAAVPLLVPMFIMFGIVLLIAMIPVLFRMRMANFCLLDEPRRSALAALRASSKMMRGRFFAMLKIDLRLWPYHLAMTLLTVLIYSDVLLMLLGIPLPLDGATFATVIYGISALVKFGIQILLRSSAECTYLMAYEQLREKKDTDGVVLGNIFDT